MTMYEKYCRLDTDGRWIGLEKRAGTSEYFCTPAGSKTIGWENSIQYCFIGGHRDMVFAVNPESCADRYVYPLAANFRDFLRLILACGSTTAIEQIIVWSKEQFERFVAGENNAPAPERQKALDTIRKSLGLEPMEEPYEYVRAVQADFDAGGGELRYSAAYYDALGLEPPPGMRHGGRLLEFPPVAITLDSDAPQT